MHKYNQTLFDRIEPKLSAIQPDILVMAHWSLCSESFNLSRHNPQLLFILQENLLDIDCFDGNARRKAYGFPINEKGLAAAGSFKNLVDAEYYVRLADGMGYMPVEREALTMLSANGSSITDTPLPVRTDTAPLYFSNFRPTSEDPDDAMLANHPSFAV